MGKIIHLYCYICGQGFGSASLPKHLKVCPEQWKNDQSHLPIKLQKGIPNPPKAEMPSSLKDQAKCKAWNEEAYAIAKSNRNNCPYCGRGFNCDNIVKHVHICKKKPEDAEDITVDKKKTTTKPKFFICGICGREFGTASITIHLPQCFEDFKNEQKLVDASLRRPVPDLDAMLKEIEEIKADNKITQAEITAQRENAMKAYKEGLAECPTCHRTFESEALAKHIKSCRVREFKFGFAVDPDAPDDETDEESESDGTGTHGKPEKEDESSGDD